jgi:hypothetical protein
MIMTVQDHLPARTISKCSSMVFLVNGLVGFVELGSTFGSLTILIMSGACPPPAPLSIFHPRKKVEMKS